MNSQKSYHPGGRKYPGADLRKHYTIFLQIGLILTLAIFNALARIELTPGPANYYSYESQEIVEMEEIIQTRQVETPPPPPRLPVPQAVPDDEVIEDLVIQFDSELHISETLSFPPPPPQQEEEEDREEFFIIVEQMPELIGGLEELQKRIRYPEIARRAGIEGRVYVQFIVNEKGEIENPLVVRGIGGGCDEEAVRAISLAKFRPGLQRGRPVRVQYSLPVLFRLQS